MTREEINVWYMEQKIPAKKGIILRAKEDSGRLILGVYWDGEKKGIYILHPDGRRATKRQEYNDWGTEGICYLLGGNCFWGVDTYNTKQSWADKESREVGDPYINNLCPYCYQDKIVEKLKSIDRNYNEAQRDKREINKQRRIMDYIDLLPDLPKDFDLWCREVVFKGEHYMFGRVNSDKYFCTACQKEHTSKKLRDRQTTVCKRTGRTVKVTKRKDSIEKREQVQLVQNMPKDGHKFGDSAVARHLYVWAVWNNSGMHIQANDAMVLVLPKNKTPCTKWFYHVNWCLGDMWIDKNKGNFRIKREYMYPHTVKEALDGTVYGSLGLEVAASLGWHMNYNSLMIDYKYPETEYLIKGGFRALVDDIAQEGWARIVINRKGRDIREVLQLDGQSVARLRKNNGNYTYLRWLQAAYVCGYKIPEETMKWFSERFVSPHSIAFALNFGMSPEKTANYLQKQIDMTGEKSENIISRWRDYLDMARKLNLDTSREAVYRPKDLKLRHDELSQMISAEKDKLESERIEKEYPDVAPTCKRIKELYEWQGDGYTVVVPEGAADIRREGRLLRHCVGSTDRYFDRIAEGESYIMFLRKSTSPKTPWYTMEVEPGGKVRQLRTMGDDEGKDRKEAKAALKEWQKEIYTRLRKTDEGKKELEASEVSREKRLAEFEELRRGGNIIRNGKLAGKLLVEVLEADFKEYNEDQSAS